MVLNAFLLSFIEKPLLLKKLTQMRYKQYVSQVIVPSIKVFTLSMPAPVLFIIFSKPSFLRLVLTTIISIVSIGITVLYIGMDKQTRLKIMDKVIFRINKLKREK